MKRHLTILLSVTLTFAALPLKAQNQNSNQVIVRDTNGLNGILNSCGSVGCTVNAGLDGSQGQLFLVTANQSSGGGGLLGWLLSLPFNLLDFILRLLTQPGVTNAEPNQVLNLGSTTVTPPSGLWDTTPVNYYGNTVWDGYVHQPATYIINLPDVQSTYRLTGKGVLVAVIDTGIDPNHPAFQGVLVPGYDFTRNTAGGSEMGDINQSTAAVVDGNAYPAQVNQSTAAVVDQNGQNTLSQSQYSDFGHGTMTAGVVHLVAPMANIMPLKAFNANGTGQLSDVLRASYYAIQHGAKVISMSFDFPSYSQEMNRAMNSANRQGIICVASAGNDGKDELVYPAAYTSTVLGIASTNDQDQLSSFSNYGRDLVWVGAPGEGVISPYPYSTYAAGWGTSFSAPMVSGAAALMLQLDPDVNQYAAAQALAHANDVDPSQLNHGRVDLYQAMSAVQ
jgi:subtilisin family serine protease